MSIKKKQIFFIQYTIQTCLHQNLNKIFPLYKIIRVTSLCGNKKISLIFVAIIFGFSIYTYT